MNEGDVFRFLRIADIHVWMIISDPARDSKNVLMVNFTSEDPDVDQACLVLPGEHPFITCRTLIEYARARVTNDAAIEQLRAAGRLEMFEPLSAALLAKVRNCAMLSTTLKTDFADILEQQELVD